MRLPLLAFAPLFAASLAAVHCGGTTYNAQGAPDGGPLDGEVRPPTSDAVGATTASKVDILLVVDNSASMEDKAKVLSTSVGTLLRKVVAAGDVHVGVISSSLGTMGGDVCPNTGRSGLDGLVGGRSLGRGVVAEERFAPARRVG